MRYALAALIAVLPAAGPAWAQAIQPPAHPSPAPAPPPAAGADAAGGSESAGPLDVTADQAIEWLQQDKAYVARGNAVAKRGTVTLMGDTLVAYYRPKTPPAGAPAKPAAGGTTAGGTTGEVGFDSSNTEIWRVVGEGNVHMNSQGRDAYGDRMVYDADKRIVVLTGHALKATSPLETVTARDTLEYWQDQNLGIARGNALATKLSNGQRSEERRVGKEC